MQVIHGAAQAYGSVAPKCMTGVAIMGYTIRMPLDIHADEAAVRAALATTEGIAGWWSDSVEGNPEQSGGDLRVHFPDVAQPFEFAVGHDEHGISWRTGAFPPWWQDTTIGWQIGPHPETSATLLRFAHSGFDPTTTSSRSSPLPGRISSGGSSSTRRRARWTPSPSTVEASRPRTRCRGPSQGAPQPPERSARVSVDVRTEIVIERPRAEVAAYASDPDNATVWYANIKSVQWLSSKPLEVGSRVAFVAEFLGRRLAYTYEISELTPERFVMRTADGPFEMETTYAWTDTSSGGTRMTLRNRGNPSGFSRLVAPMMGAAMRRANRKDLRRLKDILESGSPAHG